MRDLVVACWRCSLTRNWQTRGIFQEEVDPNTSTYILEKNSLHSISNLQYVQFHVVTKRTSHSLSSLEHTTNVEIKPRIKSFLTGRQKQYKILRSSFNKVVEVTYKSPSSARGSNWFHLTRKNQAFLFCGRLGEVVAHGESTALYILQDNYAVVCSCPISAKFLQADLCLSHSSSTKHGKCWFLLATESES